MAHCDAGGRGRPPHQPNANRSPLYANEQVLGDEQVVAFAKGSVSILFKPNSGVYMPSEVEVIVH